MYKVFDLLKSGELRLQKALCESPRIDAEILLFHALKCERLDLYVGSHKAIDKESAEEFLGYICRRERHEPIAYITKTKEFYGNMFEVNPSVLIPRPDTETLVDVALANLPIFGERKIIDLCTGSGCIAIALAIARPNVQIIASDNSVRALSVAQRNIARYGLEKRIELRLGSLLEPNMQERGIDLIVANPPYISSIEFEGLSPDVKDYEPPGALLGAEVDGLGFHREILTNAHTALTDEGAVILEIGFNQRAQMERFEPKGYASPTFYNDDAGHCRVVHYKTLGQRIPHKGLSNG